MTVKGAKPVQPVRVFVTYEALAGLDATNIRDLAAAFEHFDEYRKRIEVAASAKFDRASTDAFEFYMPTRATIVAGLRTRAPSQVERVLFLPHQ